MIKFPNRITIRIDFTMRTNLEAILAKKPYTKVSRLMRVALRKHLEELNKAELSDRSSEPSSQIAAMSDHDRSQTPKAKTGARATSPASSGRKKGA